jgi:magnesium transporter
VDPAFDVVSRVSRTESDRTQVERWTFAIAPDQAALSRLEAEHHVPVEHIKHALDVDERPRTERTGDSTLVVLRVPFREPAGALVPYSTVPLSLIFSDGTVSCVCRHETRALNQLRLYAASSDDWRRHSIVLHTLQVTAEAYLDDLKAINDAVDQLEDRLRGALENREVLEILRYQKSLVHFAAALESIDQLVRRLQKNPTFHVPPEDEGLLDDVLTEVRQAFDMATISRDILSEMMDAFASIISNNLNIVMKFLAAITVILTVPITVASFYGMNVLLPLQQRQGAFWVLIAVSALLSALVAVVFRRRGWL